MQNYMNKSNKIKQIPTNLNYIKLNKQIKNIKKNNTFLNLVTVILVICQLIIGYYFLKFTAPIPIFTDVQNELIMHLEEIPTEIIGE